MTSGKDMENSNPKEPTEAPFNPKEHTRALFSVLAHVIAVAKSKFDMERAANRDRQGWGRLIVDGVDKYGRLLAGAEYQDLERRISLLEGEKPKPPLEESS